MKAALVDEFRERKEIMIATESAGEGLNLQFCALVVNYDLPWNPQRVEQRIGRCHRYGQKHDVIVVNFVDLTNRADQRVHELLGLKLNLFNGVFGASDEILGAVASDLDLEREILNIHLRCRLPADIDREFDALRARLDDVIRSRMQQVERSLIENLDEEVRSRLGLHTKNVASACDEQRRALLGVTRFELGHEASFDGDETFDYRGTHGTASRYDFDWKRAEEQGAFWYRSECPLAQMVITRARDRVLEVRELCFHYERLRERVGALESLRGRAGWLEVCRIEIESLRKSDILFAHGLIDGGDRLDQELAAKLFLVPADVSGVSPSPPPDLASVRELLIMLMLSLMRDQDEAFRREEEDKLDRLRDDREAALQRMTVEHEQQLLDLRKSLRALPVGPARDALKPAIRRDEDLLIQLRMMSLRALDEMRVEHREQLDRIEERIANAVVRSTPIFAVRWRLD
jgi:adenine-specific DNA-methyltransferase